jgi:lipopolysaccharide/colanic/teichoic acid biosynthesis glycosyltransferase
VKRALDLAVAATALILLSPLLAVVALLVRAKLGRPILFVQDRAGLHHRVFRMYKFRTMLDVYSPDGTLKPDGERLTGFGRFLRASSLDELPELINILKGDMSLVGPRPLLVSYVPLYDSVQRRRHDVRPGITGWAQINGRNGLPWEHRLAHDIWYVDHHSLWLDLKILLLTPLKVLRRDGISAEGEATMPVFTGSAARD